ncbi:MULTISPECIES: molybdopterin adenylyltransferase [unclassified Ochrobactrum]|uniref:molybdopterin adenylyltransferase n=1 Tax=unclassified Ochrobactrum TaxID=239106 RepID=UPI000DEFF692|nr:MULTISPECIES: molybdopterin adenylyltransferase [unclassified Ochrobactrum]MBQ0707313.1 molybdopterin adenylyltransferase [Ochrobactrum sp. AP1BH01-1]
MVKIGFVTVSDRASRGEYEDLSGPAMEAWIKSAVVTPYETIRRVIPDGMESVRDTLIDLSDNEACDLILTTGGTGPSQRDETPEAMQAVLHKELPGFGELMRRVSLEQTPTAILSRQTAGSRGKSFILNLPGKPASIAMTLQAIFPAVPYCLDLIGAGWIDTDPAVVKAHRPG